MALPAEAATFTVSDAAELNNALATAKANGTNPATSKDTIQLTADIIGSAFVIDSPVVINGNNNGSKFVVRNTNGAGNLFTVRSPDVEIKNVRFEFTGATGLGVRIDNALRVTVRDCVVVNGLYGVRAFGAAPKDLYVLNNSISNSVYGIEFNRDVVTAGTSAAALNGGHFEVSGNVLTNVKNGISWDGGNDGTTKNSDYPQLRSEVDFKPSVFASTAVIKDNTLTGFAGLGIAFSHISTVRVEHNTLTMATTSTESFRNAIHIEKSTANLTIGGTSDALGNTITTGTSASTGIRVFRPTNPAFANAPWPTDIKLLRNRVIDLNGNVGIGGGGFVGLSLNNNRVDNGNITFTGSASDNQVKSLKPNLDASGATINVTNITMTP